MARANWLNVAIGLVGCGFSVFWSGLLNSGTALASEVWHVAIGVAAALGQKQLEVVR